jgi:hypothetical protein
MNNLHTLLSGASMFASLVAATFFVRFWIDTRDRLFSLFALAFALLAVNRALLGLEVAREAHQYVYLVRLAAFVIIALAIVDKNRR